MECACGKTISANKTACRACLEAQERKAVGGGVLEILNCQAGDMKISFDKSNPGEAIRAKRIIQDMLRRGYALVVEVERDGKTAYERVQEFDAERGEYLVSDFDSYEAMKADAREASAPVLKETVESTADNDTLCQCGRPKRHRGACKGVPRNRRRLPMETTKATAVGRSAGG